ncbi:MAG: HD domain-containing protein [Desulfatirhabdiaceae bacterium]|nr:HD domain-containing protein [Desulfatirhabdiaceae bacterium]
MLNETEKLNALMDLGIKLNQVQDLDILMEHLLTEARRFVNADAGTIYVRDKDSLHFTYTQNDTLQQRLGNGEKLIYSAFSVPINSKTIAGYVASEGSSLNILDVYEMESEASYAFGKEFDQKVDYRTRSMMTLPLRVGNGDVLGVLQIINAQDAAGYVIAFSDQDQKMMMLFASFAAVALERAQMIRALLLRMIRMAEMRDPNETGPHVNRVAAYSVELYERWAKRHSVPEMEIDRNRDILRRAAMLHDVGKVAIPDRLLQKPGRFTKSEFLVMKLHTIRGAQLFSDRQSDFDDMAREVALNHHERWDGKGYPGEVDIGAYASLNIQKMLEDSHDGADESVIQRIENILTNGKQKEEIPIFARIVALADVYDALSSKRSYKEACSEKEVCTIIEKEAGAQFDPELVEIFLSNSCMSMFSSIRQRYKDHPQELACVMKVNCNSSPAAIKIPEMKNIQDLLKSSRFQFKKSDMDACGPAIKELVQIGTDDNSLQHGIG